MGQLKNLTATGAEFGVSRQTVHRWRAEGAPGFTRLGKQRSVCDTAELRPWVAEHRPCVLLKLVAAAEPANS